MLRAMSTDNEQNKGVAIICVVAFLAANAAFYFLSDSYFDSHRQIVVGKGSVPTFSPDEMTAVRISFAVFAGVIAVTSFFAGIRARLTGHLLPLLLGAIHLVASVASFNHGLKVLGVTLLLVGGLMPVLSWQSYFHRVRPAWAFLVAICGVFAVAEFFGAPKIRGAVDISLWITMILPGLNVVTAFALISLRGEYVERDPVAA